MNPSDVKLPERAELETMLTSLQNQGTYLYEGWGSKFSVQDFIQTSDTPAGDHFPESGYIGFGKVTTLNVTGTLEEKSVTANGVYTPVSPYTGFSKVTVNVPPGIFQTKTVTANGEYTPDEGFDGFNKVIVALSTETLNVTANGLYQPTAPNVGFRTVEVNVPTGGTYQEKTVTVNGVVTPDTGYDALSKVTVNVSGGGGDPDENLNKLLTAQLTNYTNTVLTVIKPYAFAYSVDGMGGGLKSISLPNLTDIWLGAFMACSVLETANLPLITEIPDMCFQSCEALTNSGLTCPNVTKIGYEGLDGTALTVAPDFVKNCTEVGARAFSNTQIPTLDLSSVEVAGEESLTQMKQLTSVKYKNVTEFQGCLLRAHGEEEKSENLATIDLTEVTAMPTCGKFSFAYEDWEGATPRTIPITVKVPSALLPQFQADENWLANVNRGDITLQGV